MSLIASVLINVCANQLQFYEDHSVAIGIFYGYAWVYGYAMSCVGLEMNFLWCDVCVITKI